MAWKVRVRVWAAVAVDEGEDEGQARDESQTTMSEWMDG